MFDIYNPRSTAEKALIRIGYHKRRFIDENSPYGMLIYFRGATIHKIGERERARSKRRLMLFVVNLMSRITILWQNRKIDQAIHESWYSIGSES